MGKFKLFDKPLGGIVYGDSTDISYDNTSSKLDASNAQDAIDELNKKKLSTNGDSENVITTFTSNDSTTNVLWNDVEVLTSKEKHSSLFNKISTMFKNVRYLYKMLGTTNISELGTGDGKGTVTGALDSLNSNLGNRGITESGDDYIKFGNGTLLCFGLPSTDDSTYATVIFPVRFIATPIILATAQYTSEHYYHVYIREMSEISFNVQTLYTNNASGLTKPGTYLNFSYLAIGRWK